MHFKLEQAKSLAETIAALYAGQIEPNVFDLGTDTQAVVIEQPDRSYAVIFPGTASVNDWRTDLHVKKVDWDAGRVHRGFAAAYQSIHAQLVSLLPADAHLTIAGHSLGGALATLAALRLNVGYQIDAVYTFGSPRVGNGPFARAYDAQFHDFTFRIVNEGDPVPHVPWVLGTYRHLGTRVFLNDDGRIEVSPPLWRGLIPKELSATGAAAEFCRVSAHSIRSYLQKLNEGTRA